MQRNDRQSLLSWFERMIHTLREAPEVGAGSCEHVDVPVPRGVLAHRAVDSTGSMLFLHNLADSACEADMSSLAAEAGYPVEVLSDDGYDPITDDLATVALNGYGFRWIRLRRNS